MKERFLIYVIVAVIAFFLGLSVVIVINSPTAELKMEPPPKRFEVVFTSTGLYGIIRVIKDNSTGCEYLMITSDGGTGLTKLEKN